MVCRREKSQLLSQDLRPGKALCTGDPQDPPHPSFCASGNPRIQSKWRKGKDLRLTSQASDTAFKESSNIVQSTNPWVMSGVLPTRKPSRDQGTKSVMAAVCCSRCPAGAGFQALGRRARIQAQSGAQSRLRKPLLSLQRVLLYFYFYILIKIEFYQLPPFPPCYLSWNPSHVCSHSQADSLFFLEYYCYISGYVCIHVHKYMSMQSLSLFLLVVCVYGFKADYSALDN